MRMKKILSIIGVIVIVVFAMLVPSDLKKYEKDQQTQSTTSVSTENESVKNSTNEESCPNEESTEFFGGIRIGTSNIILLSICGLILLINKVRDIKAEHSKKTDE